MPGIYIYILAVLGFWFFSFLFAVKFRIVFRSRFLLLFLLQFRYVRTRVLVRGDPAVDAKRGEAPPVRLDVSMALPLSWR